MSHKSRDGLRVEPRALGSVLDGVPSHGGDVDKPRALRRPGAVADNVTQAEQGPSSSRRVQIGAVADLRVVRLGDAVHGVALDAIAQRLVPLFEDIEHPRIGHSKAKSTRCVRAVA